MERRDLIQKQIDQLGKALAGLLSRLLNLKSQEEVSSAIMGADQGIKDELNLSVEEILQILPNDLIDILKGEKNISNENLDKLAELLFTIAGMKQAIGENSDKLFKQCLTIYEYLEKVETTYSYERRQRIERIKSFLS